METMDLYYAYELDLDTICCFLEHFEIKFVSR